uniref:Uncharacterized protein n=1 Tax=Glossina pallidipes TaxID=7398 RepID=A0A1A9ZD46_GLOPL
MAAAAALSLVGVMALLRVPAKDEVCCCCSCCNEFELELPFDELILNSSRLLNKYLRVVGAWDLCPLAVEFVKDNEANEDFFGGIYKTSLLSISSSSTSSSSAEDGMKLFVVGFTCTVIANAVVVAAVLINGIDLVLVINQSRYIEIFQAITLEILQTAFEELVRVSYCLFFLSKDMI